MRLFRAIMLPSNNFEENKTQTAEINFWPLTRKHYLQLSETGAHQLRDNELSSQSILSD